MHRPADLPALAFFHCSPAGLVRDATAPADQEWLQERFRVAARKRYQALLTAAELQRPSSPRRQADARQGAVDSPEAVAAYGRLEELCRAIMNELRADEQIRDARVLPGFVPLPDITALEYVNVSGWGWRGARWQQLLPASRCSHHACSCHLRLLGCAACTNCPAALLPLLRPSACRASSSTSARC